MGRRVALALTALALSLVLGGCAFAEADVPAIHDFLFLEAKQSLMYFDEGEYEYAAMLLGFADADELSKFVTKNYETIGAGVQTKVSVAYWTGAAWSLAVPLNEPSDAEVEALVLISADGLNFSGYQYATWGQVEEAYAACSYVIWNEEYVESAPRIIGDN
ncbi:MAG: hypothetical protein ACOYI5_00895 [Christensenellales bacterium]|jgi:hypothetical protein